MSRMNFLTHLKPSKPFAGTKKLVILVFLLTCAIFGFSSLDDTFDTPVENVRDGGDCPAIGPRRPKWANRKKMLKALPKFVRIYDRRPIKCNQGGMRFDHSFALWYMLRITRPVPSVIVESGAFRGHSTWVIRQALPHVKIISLSPDTPAIEVKNTVYLNGNNFQDFNAVRWEEMGVDVRTALVFLDDHQSARRRIFEEGSRRGFRRFISEDNYDYLKGDNLSMKWLCEVDRGSEWRGYIPDNFGRSSTNQTWQEHLDEAHKFGSLMRYYYEFPPVATSNITGQSRFDESRTTSPLIANKDVFSKRLGDMPLDEFHVYTHICYVELTGVYYALEFPSPLFQITIPTSHCIPIVSNAPLLMAANWMADLVPRDNTNSSALI